MAVAGPPQHVWAVLAKAFGIDDPAPPEADVPTKARLRHAAIERWMAAQPSRDALLAQLERERIPCAAVVTLREALTGDFARERELLHDVDDRRGGTRPLRACRTASRTRCCAPGNRRRCAASTTPKCCAKCSASTPPASPRCAQRGFFSATESRAAGTPSAPSSPRAEC